jgi:hypothetical protein
MTATWLSVSLCTTQRPWTGSCAQGWLEALGP